MTEREKKILNRIPKKYRKHIVELKVSETEDYNDNGRMLYNYTLIFDI